MAEGDSSHYEVSIRVGNRWEIQGRFPVTKKDVAMEEAHNFERTANVPVKVSRETFDPSSGLYKEIIVYRTRGARYDDEGTAGGAGGGQGGGGFDDHDDDIMEFDQDGYLLGEGDDDYGGFDDFDDYDERPKKKARRRAGGADPYKGLGIRVLIMTLLSLLVSGGVTWILSSSHQKLNSLQRAFNLAGHDDVLMVVFLSLFFISFLALALVVLSDLIAPSSGKVKAKATATAKASAVTGQTKEEAAGAWLKDREASGNGKTAEKGSTKTTEAEKKEGEPEEMAFDAPPMTEEPEEEEEAPAEEPSEEAEPEEEVVEPEPEPEPEEGSEEEAQPELSQGAERQRRQMQEFMQVVASEIEGGVASLDTFNRFGVSLYVAGAVGSLANDVGLEQSETVAILSECVQGLGTNADQARKFAEAYESYLLNVRYMEMFETGRLAVNGHLEGDREGARRLGAALQVWNKPKKAEEPTGAVAVMFTDMVGSTDLNQTVGDVAAQTVVHTHNRIVRGVLADYYGREVKHTGDGIMASFPNTANAVKAGIVMQKRVAAYNKSGTDIPLHLRIGINVGEPIQEDEDLFGVTVQLSARLCAACKTDGVLVSESVKAMCAGKDIKFQDCGTRNLKGLPEPVHVFEPVWDAGGGQKS